MRTEINAEALDYRTLNEQIRASQDCAVRGCLGQRFIGAGMKNKSIALYGIPGNALGAYLAGASVEVFGNAQDAVGDTMNDGTIVVHGSIGDAAGYAMRGGAIYVAGDAGYRAGIHMKEYKEKRPVIVIGGCCGSFLGEYQAGGLILVLGMNRGERPVVGDFPCTGMHGGMMVLRGDVSGIDFPANVSAKPADGEVMEVIRPYLEAYCSAFGYSLDDLIRDSYTVVTPDTKNPYKQMYAAN